jgi:excisionase family DNA binding protein
MLMNPSSETRFSHTLSTVSPPAENADRLLVGIDEVARMLNISARTVWTLTKTGGLPHLRIGRRVLYPVDAICRWTAERTRGGASSS